MQVLLEGAAQVVAVRLTPPGVKSGTFSPPAQGPARMNQVDTVTDASVLVGPDGLIKAVGPKALVRELLAPGEPVQVYDCSGLILMPGLVDAHTHPVWVGDRVHEYAMKLKGATYMDIHKAGGGIGFTVDKVRKASEDELLIALQQRMHEMLAFGTVVADAKSGYGLNLETELKMLRVIHKASQAPGTVQLVGNYCGAHSVPKGSTAEEATKRIVEEDIPAIAAAKAAGEISAELIDVFCEKGVFGIEETQAILEAGKKFGFHANFHGDEIHPMKAAELAAKIKAMSISHLEMISDDGIKAVADSGTVAVLLPTTALVLNLDAPPARKLIDSGACVALGSDFNPNAYCLSMPMTMSLSCAMFRMSMEETLVAATLNAAAAINRISSHGTLEVGKRADMLILQCPRWEHLIYRMGCDSPIVAVFLGGKPAHVSKREAHKDAVSSLFASKSSEFKSTDK